MKLESKLILASKNAETGVILYTFVLTYPRCILAEVNTHRMFSRNTASSRAIPSKKQRANILNNPFIPLSIGENQKGMQAGRELTGWRRSSVEWIIRLLRYPSVAAVWVMDKLGAHKQVINRYLEPWMWVQQIVTATDFKNFAVLRNNGMAEPHFHKLAAQMQKQIDSVIRCFDLLAWPGSTIDRRLDINSPLGVGTVQMLEPGEWHLPFIDTDELSDALSDAADVTSPLPSVTSLELLKQISAARCARVSYLLPENGQRSDANRDIELCNRLSSSGHWSPFEHVATPIAQDAYIGNFRSFKQYRKEFSNEHGGDRI